MSIRRIEFSALERRGVDELDLHRQSPYSLVRVAYDTSEEPAQLEMIILNTEQITEQLKRSGRDHNRYTVVLVRTPADELSPMVVSRHLVKDLSWGWQMSPLTAMEGTAPLRNMGVPKAITLERAGAQLPLKLLHLPRGERIELTTHQGTVTATLEDPPLKPSLGGRRKGTRAVRVNNEVLRLDRFEIGTQLFTGDERTGTLLEYRVL